MKRWLRPDTLSRRLLIAVLVYAVVTGVCFSIVPRYRILEHTPFNHFTLLADAWLDGRLSLDGQPPSYAQNNDFARAEGKWYVTFPPFPAVLILPLAWAAGTPENVRDGQFFIWLSGVGPALLFLALERLRLAGRSGRSERADLILSLLFAFGTVYFFTAVQGTVWFAAHVVGVGLAALYVLCALDARRPWLAGLALGMGFLTRSPLIFAAPLFAFEAVRASVRRLPTPSSGSGAEVGPAAERNAEAPGFTESEKDSQELSGCNDSGPEPQPERPAPSLSETEQRPVAAQDERQDGLPPWRQLWSRLDKAALLRRYVAFSLPILAAIGFALWHNNARFGDFFDFGYEHLTVAWQSRMKKWGLFDYHFLGRNLGVILTSFPWVTGEKAPVPFQINSHGLALWITTPLYLWLLWPKRLGGLQIALYVTAAAVALPTLFYQNTGWIQFGYRFSNDYAVFLFVLLAVAGHRFGRAFYLFAAWSVLVNAFGAVTFDRPQYKKFYYEDASQKVIYQPD